MRSPKRSGKRFLLLLCGLLLAAPRADAQETGPTEYQVKAAFLYGFVKFVEWPTAMSSLNLCVLGQDPFGGNLDEIDGRSAAGMVLSVSRMVSLGDLRGCGVLFVASSESERLDRILMAAQGLPILVVGDTAGFAERGVIINFYKKQNRVAFEVNKDAAGRSGLKISSKLLGLARIVQDARRRVE